MKVGYARPSASGPDLSAQVQLLKGAGCSVIHREKRSGAARGGRKALEAALKATLAEAGSSLVVVRLDRLATSLGDLETIASRLRAGGASLKVLGEQIDTATASGGLFFHLLGAFARFEAALRHERQLEGIARAKAEGRPFGRPTTAPVEAIQAALAEGKKVAEIHTALGVPRTTIYRVRDAMDRP